MQNPWLHHRKQVRLFWGMWLGWIPFGGAVMIPIQYLRLPQWLGFCFLVPYLVYWMLLGMRLSKFRCPACARPFYVKGWLRNNLTGKCLHCGLKKYEVPPFFVAAIAPGDDAGVASLIRDVMPEFGAGGPGFAIHDAEVDHMHEAYNRPRSAYFVVRNREGRVVGGAGIAPLEGGDRATCELRKMYFRAELRGQGYGPKLMALCLDAARRHKFKRCYLETLNSMTAARKLYAKTGFKELCSPEGATGHFSCDRWYALDL
jgi:putative acetyltransferase